MRARALLALPLILTAAAITPRASAADAGVAALQVGLRSHGLYQGPIDGLSGPGTAKAIRRLQKSAHISVDGVVGPQTRKALGRFASHRLGTRKLELGNKGWDVASLQFRLAEHGFPSGTFDGAFGPHTEAAVWRFQEWAGLAADGAAGPATLRALAAPPATSPISFSPPLYVPYTDGFGPRGARFHTGVDFPAPSGTPVLAARSGVVTITRWVEGYGNMVAIRHKLGMSTVYAHLSAFLVHEGERVAVGQPIGRVGSTGESSGPHLHFEVRVRGAPIDPLPAFG
jgi:murein DD-endopeptidase MepM/ murein hydrolase activator NlpD